MKSDFLLFHPFMFCVFVKNRSDVKLC